MTASTEPEQGRPPDRRRGAADAVRRLRSERDEALRSEQRQQRRTTSLGVLAHSLAGAEDTAVVAQVLAAALPEVLSCDASAVWLWDPEPGEVRAAATAGLTPELHEALVSVRVKASETPELAEMLTRREPLVLNVGAVTPTLEAMLQGLGLQAAIGVALLSGSRLLGAVTACWRDGPLAGWALTEAVSRLQGVSDHAATALLNALLLQDARHQARHDALTRLPNRGAFHDALDVALRADGPGTAVVYGDLDRFKQVNDQLGHAAGDEVLRLVSRRLSTAVGAAGMVARLSGDEFAVLLPGTATPSAALGVAQSLVQSLSEPLRVEGHHLQLTVSVGAALHAGPGGEREVLLRSADAAMYAAKRSGRNQVVLAEPGATHRPGPAPSLAAELRAGLGTGQLRLALQPIVRLGAAAEGDRQEVVGAEALVRWQHPRLGLLAPATFVALAEEDGSIVDVDLWVLRSACAAAAAWPEPDDGTVPHIAVNLSPWTLADAQLFEAVRRTLLETGLAPERLHVEVVESRALHDLPRVIEVLSTLRHLGVRVSLDDFGTGFSTLSWLHELPVDRIKVDRSFTASTTHPHDDRRRDTANALLRGVAGVGRELGVEVLAEGVETAEQLAAVRDAGLRLAQGYLLGRPAPPEAMRGLLGRNKPPLADRSA